MFMQRAPHPGLRGTTKSMKNTTGSEVTTCSYLDTTLTSPKKSTGGAVEFLMFMPRAQHPWAAWLPWLRGVRAAAALALGPLLAKVSACCRGSGIRNRRAPMSAYWQDASSCCF